MDRVLCGVAVSRFHRFHTECKASAIPSAIPYLVPYLVANARFPAASAIIHKKQSSLVKINASL